MILDMLTVLFFVLGFALILWMIVERRRDVLHGPYVTKLGTARGMKQSDLYRQNAENCKLMAEAAQGAPAYNRYKRMEAAWVALAEEQDWLDGDRSPVDPPEKGNRQGSISDG
jgi:hypothetical protein